MQNKRFIIEKYRTSKDRHTCPNCDNSKCFSRYFDTETEEFIADHVGICNHRESCGYNYTGWGYIKDNPEYNKGKNFTPKSSYNVSKIETETKLPTYVDRALFESTLGYNQKNTLHRWLVNLFGQAVALCLIGRFNIGTTPDGKAIMWRIDIHGNILSSDIIEYVAKKSEETFTKTDCKRTSRFNSVRSYYNLKDFTLSQCCFGEQYLNEGKPIFLVESAKTVLIASVYLPQYTWIACEGLANFSITFTYLNSLKGRDIFLMPDCGAGFIDWSKKAESKEMKAFFNSVTVDNRLQNSPLGSRNGYDIGDFCLQLAPPKFETPAPETMPAVATKPEPSITVATVAPESVTDKNNSLGILPQSDYEVVAIHDTPQVEEIPFWKEIPQISDNDFKLKCEILDWWNKRFDLFEEGSMIVIDGLAVPDINSVIRKHVKVIHNDNSSAIVSIKFLEKVRKLITEKSINVTTAPLR